MLGCRGCNRGCSSYREKHIISRFFALLGLYKLWINEVTILTKYPPWTLFNSLLKEILKI